ncbi:hypothetical protein FKM82_012544 [Ascaphus truei]
MSAILISLQPGPSQRCRELAGEPFCLAALFSSMLYLRLLSEVLSSGPAACWWIKRSAASASENILAPPFMKTLKVARYPRENVLFVLYSIMQTLLNSHLLFDFAGE